MREITREITEEQYRKATEKQDATGIFSEAEVIGYGVYCTRYYQQDGKYFVKYEIGDSCD